MKAPLIFMALQQCSCGLFCLFTTSHALADVGLLFFISSSSESNPVYMNHHSMHIKCQPLVVLSPECLQLMLLDEPPIMTSTSAMVLHPLAGGTMAGSCHITISVIIFLYLRGRNLIAFLAINRITSWNFCCHGDLLAGSTMMARAPPPPPPPHTTFTVWIDCSSYQDELNP